MNASPPSASFRRSLSPAARALRLQRVFARMQEGAAYAEIAAEENISRERLGQIIRRATLRQSQDDEPSHRQMQVARLTPAFRLAAAGVAKGDAKSIPLLSAASTGSTAIPIGANPANRPRSRRSPGAEIRRRASAKSRNWSAPALAAPGSARPRPGAPGRTRTDEALDAVPRPRGAQPVGKAQNGDG